MNGDYPHPEYRPSLEVEQGLLPPEPLAYGEPVSIPPVRPTPNLLHALVFFLLLGVVLVLVQFALYALAMGAHMFHGESPTQLQHEPLLLVPSEIITYLLTLVLSAGVFRLWWGRSFGEGISWNSAQARRLSALLIPAGLLLGFVVQWGTSFLPVPKTLPVDKFFSTPLQVWLAMFLGVFIAPVIEELAFRGFLLPSLERLTGRAIAISITSACFAALHGMQIAWSWPPLLAIFTVSVALCVVRLRTGSVAASALVHAAYNASDFALLFVATGGYRHLDKLNG